MNKNLGFIDGSYSFNCHSGRRRPFIGGSTYTNGIAQNDHVVNILVEFEVKGITLSFGKNGVQKTRVHFFTDLDVLKTKRSFMWAMFYRNSI